MYSNAKVGDKAYIRYELQLAPYVRVSRAKLFTIDRVTATQIVVGDARFNKNNGRQIGGLMRLLNPETLTDEYGNKVPVTTEEDDIEHKKLYRLFEAILMVAKNQFGSGDSRATKRAFDEAMDAPESTMREDLLSVLDKVKPFSGETK